jgi:hypothetical protein
MADKKNDQKTDEARREFLRKSVYAAYATPIITTLLIAKESAAISFTGTPKENKDACAADGGKWFAGGAGQACCNYGPNDGCGPDG